MSERWQPAPRTEQARAAHAAAEADRAARPHRYRLDPDHLAAAAVRAPDDAARFAPGWRAGLEAYLGSAREDGRLNALGTAMVAATAMVQNERLERSSAIPSENLARSRRDLPGGSV